MSEGTAEIYEFEGFRLNVTEHFLVRPDGERLQLTDKAFDTLCVLVRNGGHLVKKSELLDEVWADSFVEENNLNKCVHTLRRSLGETNGGTQFIETVKKHGFRFVPCVHRVSDNGVDSYEGNGFHPVQTAVSPAEAPAEADGGRPKDEPASTTEVLPWYQYRPVLVAAIAFGLLGLVVVAGSFLLRSTPKATPGRTQFAVLPLKPIDAANRSDIYEIGVAEGLIHRLNSINGFVARPLSATRKYDALDQDPIAAGRDQKVDHVLASNYQLADGRFRITAQLVNVASGVIEDTYRVETAAGDIFALQDAVTDEIAKKLITRFERTAAGPASGRGTTSDEAYRLYLQGRNLTMKRNREDHRKAIEYFEQAIKLDPNFALAYARMAHAYSGADLGADRSAEVEKVREFINKALELDPNEAEAYVTRGNVSLLRDLDFPSAEKDLVRAIELEPNNDFAHWAYALLLAYGGRFDEALTEMEAALAIDPGAVMYMFHRGRILYYARRYDEAITQYNQAIDLDDRFIQPFGWMVRAYEVKRDYATAYQFFLKREERSSRKDRLESYRKAYVANGWIGVRRDLSDSAEKNFFDMARLYALLGEKDPAFDYLNKSVENREWHLATLKVEPALDSLRDDPRFEALLTRAGLK